MNHISKPGWFPWFSIFTGTVGFALQSWLLSYKNADGLLPKMHISGILAFILFAFTLCACFLLVRKAVFPPLYSQQFPSSAAAAIGNAVGAFAFGYSVLTISFTGPLAILLCLLGLLSAVSLLAIAICRLRGRLPHYLLRCAVILFLVFRTVACCRIWGSEPQLQLYFFPLLASLLLLLTCYYRIELDMQSGDCRRYLFCNQAALFCCCLCIPGEDGLFYLGMGLWMASDCCALHIPNRTHGR